VNSKPVSLLMLFLFVFSLAYLFAKDYSTKVVMPDKEVKRPVFLNNEDKFQVLLDRYWRLSGASDSVSSAIKLVRTGKPRGVVEGNENSNKDNDNKWGSSFQSFEQEDLIDSLIERKNEVDSLLDKTTKEIKEYASKVTGSKSVRFNNTLYYLFVADLSKDEISFHFKDPYNRKKFSSLGAVKKILEFEERAPLMITNAGMFTPEFEPEGLFVENGNEIFPLDTGAERQGANFYLKPNGVFYVSTDNRPFIVTTEQYMELQKNKQFKPKGATQSGPMLVKEGRIHEAFVPGSTNLNIRSGVGILSDTKVIFAITAQGTNFSSFALFFRDVFNCQDALFLDGAISKMYLQDICPEEIDGEFGAIISVCRTKKRQQVNQAY
jgi:uncharacterized protein YigE (DUF2233 family)